MIVASSSTDENCDSLLDEDRFAALLGANLETATRVAARHLPTADVNDAVQNACLAAWRSRHSFDLARGSFRTWLLTIVTHEAQRVTRDTERRLRLTAMLVSLEIDPLPPESASHLDVGGALGALTCRQQQVVGLRYFADLPVAAVAAILEVSEGTIKSTLHDARARMREALQDRGESDD